MRFVSAFILATMVLLAGCLQEPKIDGSSEHAFKQSIQKISESLDDSKREVFDNALKVVTVNSLNFEKLFKGALKGEKPSFASAISALNGMTADQVIAKSKAVIAEREIKMQKQALQEIAELESELAAAESAKDELAKFKVLKTRFYKYKGKHDYRAKPIIELKVKNETPYPISRIYCEGTLASSGRSIPWLVESFNYAIPGGLEPGEVGDWSLAPNVFSEWGKVEAPKDAIFTVKIVRLDGPDKKGLFSASFPESKKERLQQLKDKYLSAKQDAMNATNATL